MRHLFLIVLFLFTVQTITYSAVLDTIDAVVNGELILSGEVDAMVSLELQGNSNPSDLQVMQTRRKVLRMLIDEILIIQEAREFLNDSQWDQINAQIERLTSQKMAEQREKLKSPQDVVRFEQQTRMGWEDLRKLISRQIERDVLRNEVAKALARSSISKPSEQELDEFKQQHPALAPDEQIEIAHIMLQLPPNASADQINLLKSRAQEMAKLARTGESFERLAQQFSQHEATKTKGGNLGTFKRDSILPDFAFVFDQPEGFISEPVVTKAGVHIIKVVDVPTWIDVYYKIKNDANEQNWLNGLREKAKIEIRHDRDLKEELESPEL